MCTTTFEVEHGIPIKSWRKYPFEEMEVDDSFFIPCVDTKERRRLTCAVLSLASQKRLSRGDGFRITVRTIKNSDQYGIRVWRIK